tara:strand:+ start:795 stop:1184 length:390 start_codon:yes stop_codon:yes gene_type:complete
MTKLSNVVVLDEKVLTAIANGEKKFDNRANNTGRPVNKKSNRQQRLAKQQHYNNVNKLFVSGNKFKIKHQTYTYSVGDNDGLGCIVDSVFGSHACNVDYIGRTKVTGYTFVLGKQVKITLNLKTLQFVK